MKVLADLPVKISDVLEVIDLAIDRAQDAGMSAELTIGLGQARDVYRSIVSIRARDRLFDAGMTLAALRADHDEELRRHPDVGMLVWEAEHKAAHIVCGEPTHKHEYEC
jgi:hypothetical protein